MHANFMEGSNLLRCFFHDFFLVAFLVKGKAFLRLFSIAKAFLFSLFQEESKHIASKLLQFVDAFSKKAKLYNISRTLQASNKKLPLSAFNFVDAASSDAFCLLSSSKVKLFNICCPSRATNAKAFPSFFYKGAWTSGIRYR